MDPYEAKSKGSTTETSEKDAVAETEEVSSPPYFQEILETLEETNDIVKDEKMPSATDVLPLTVSTCKIGQVCESEAKSVNASAEDFKAGTANVEVKKVDNTQSIFEIPSNVKDDRVDSNNKDKEISPKDSAAKNVGKPMTWATWKPISKSKDFCCDSTEEAKKEDDTQPISEIPSNAKDHVDSNNEDKEISSKYSAEKNVGKPTTWATWKTISKSKDCCSGNTEQAKKVDNTQPISKIPSKVKDDRVASSDKEKEISSQYSAKKNLRKPGTFTTRKPISASKDTSGITEEAKKVHNTRSISDIPSNVKDDRFASSNEDKEISSKDRAEKNLGKSRTWATRKPTPVSKDSSSDITEEAKKVHNTQPIFEIPSNLKDDCIDSKNEDKETSPTNSAEENIGKPKTWATWKDISVSKYSFSGNSDKAKKVGNTQPFSEIPSNVKEDRVDSNNNYKEISSKDSAEINVGNRTTWATWKSTSKSKDSCSGNTEVKTSDTERISPKSSAIEPVTETRESRSKIMQVGENVLHQPLSVIEDEETTEELVSDETREELLIDLGIEEIKDELESLLATSDLPNPPEKKLSLQDLEQSFISALNTPVKIDEKNHVVQIENLVSKSVQAIKIADASEFEKEKKSPDIVEDTEEKTPTEIVSEKDNSEVSDDTI